MNLQKLTKNRLHELLQMSVGLGGFSQKLLASCKYWIYLGYLFVEGTQLPMIVLLLYLCFLVAVYMHFYKLVGNLPRRTQIVAWGAFLWMTALWAHGYHTSLHLYNLKWRVHHIHDPLSPKGRSGWVASYEVGISPFSSTLL